VAISNFMGIVGCFQLVSSFFIIFAVGNQGKVIFIKLFVTNK